MGREAGRRGNWMGNTCKSMADHVNIWQKPLQYCKVISFQLIKTNEKKFQINKSVIMVIAPGGGGGGEESDAT